MQCQNLIHSYSLFYEICRKVTEKPLPGRRGPRRYDNIDEDHSRMLKTTAWDEDENYGTRMSPGLEDWREQKLLYSPKNVTKRSRWFDYLLSSLLGSAISILVDILF